MLINKYLNNKSILITGGTGSFGSAFLKRILNSNYNFKKIIVYSRDELKQFELQKLYPINKYPSLRFFIGDIRDKDRLAFALKEIDLVVHAAALKQVEASEYNPFEFIKTNIIGTQNIIDNCLASNVKKAILISTDKAVSPENLYGATKLCSEKIFVNSNYIKGKKNVCFSVVRYGNVFGSRGSVLHEFLRQKLKGKFLINDLRMTRFNIGLEESVNFVLNSLIRSEGGEIFVPKISSFYIRDLAKAICGKTKIEEIGTKFGEKIHEVLISKQESLHLKDKGEYFVIKKIEEKFIRKNKEIEYNSNLNKNFLTINHLKKIIKLYNLD
jgi:UDP-N-acetylglucosamine 4,6-dehydratase